MKICVLNQKGGTGKTTTAVHLAFALAKRNRRVLLIDNDPQGSIGVYLKKIPQGLHDLLLKEKKLADCIQVIDEKLAILASDSQLLEVEAQLHQNLQTKQLYKEALLNHDYTDIIFDMAPARSKLNQAALFYAEEVLIPVSCDYLALVGVRDILDFIEKLNQEREIPLQLRGILPTMFDSRSRISKDSVSILKNHFGDKVFPPIHLTTKAKEAPSFGKTLFEYAPQNRASQDYEWLGQIFNALR